MKKRLLITSIVMMLVVAVALSTATYAWFTSSTTVTSSSITMTAATNDAASLGISWTEGNYATAITAVGPTNNDETPANNDFFKPACPTELTVGTTTVGNSAQENHNIAFNTAFATPNAAGTDMVFGSVSTAEVYTWTDGAGHNSFFVKNMSPANEITTVRLTPTITSNGNLVRVGVFVRTSEETYFTLKAVLANKEDYQYTAVQTGDTLAAAPAKYYVKYLGKYVEAVAGTHAEVTNGTADYEAGVDTAPANTFYTQSTPEGGVAAQATYGTITPVTGSVNAMASVACDTNVVIASNLDAQDYVEVVVKVWEDAVALGDAEYGRTSEVSFSIGTV